MSAQSSSTGTFKLKLPAELMNAVEHSPLESAGRGMDENLFEPSWFERLIGWFSRRR